MFGLVPESVGVLALEDKSAKVHLSVCAPLYAAVTQEGQRQRVGVCVCVRACVKGSIAFNGYYIYKH